MKIYNSSATFIDKYGNTTNKCIDVKAGSLHTAMARIGLILEIRKAKSLVNLEIIGHNIKKGEKVSYICHRTGQWMDE